MQIPKTTDKNLDDVRKLAGMTNLNFVQSFFYPTSVGLSKKTVILEGTFCFGEFCNEQHLNNLNQQRWVDEYQFHEFDLIFVTHGKLVWKKSINEFMFLNATNSCINMDCIEIDESSYKSD